MTVTLVLGGARSGKSAYAEGLFDGGLPVRYVATARYHRDDTEFAERIEAHARRRPAYWETVETTDLRRLFETSTQTGAPLLVDDLATWLTAQLDDADVWRTGELGRLRETVTDTVAALADCACDVVLVSAETGLGVVPASASGRLFRDELGALNAAVAEVSARVTLLVAGIPMQLR